MLSPKNLMLRLCCILTSTRTRSHITTGIAGLKSREMEPPGGRPDNSRLLTTVFPTLVPLPRRARRTTALRMISAAADQPAANQRNDFWNYRYYGLPAQIRALAMSSAQNWASPSPA